MYGIYIKCLFLNDLAVETLLKKTCIYLTHNLKKKKRERELGGWGKLFF